MEHNKLFLVLLKEHFKGPRIYFNPKDNSIIILERLNKPMAGYVYIGRL